MINRIEGFFENDGEPMRGKTTGQRGLNVVGRKGKAKVHFWLAKKKET